MCERNKVFFIIISNIFFNPLNSDRIESILDFWNKLQQKIEVKIDELLLCHMEKIEFHNSMKISFVLVGSMFVFSFFSFFLLFLLFLITMDLQLVEQQLQ